LVPPAPAAEKRPCPYCGIWNSYEFAYCQRCGRQLPPLEGAAAPSPAPPPAAAAPPPPPPSYIPPPPIAAPAMWQAAPAPETYAVPPGPEAVDTSMSERPLSEAESTHLRGLLNKQPVRLPRFLAGFVAFLSLGMVAMGVMGLPFLPTEFSVIVFGTGFISAILGGVSQRTRGPVLRVLSRGVVREVWGVPSITPARGMYSTVRLAGIDFMMPKPLTDKLLQGRMNRIAYVDSGPSKGRPAMPGYVTAWLVDSNGTLESPPKACFVSESSGKVPSLPGAAPAPAMGPFMGGFR